MKYRNNILIVLGICIGILSILGTSYALWSLFYEQTKMNRIDSSCLNLSLTNEKNDINLVNAYPILDEEGKKLTPYSFTITNTCDIFASYTVNLEMLEGTTLPIKYVKSMVNKEEVQNLANLSTGTKVESTSTDSRILANGSLGSGDSVDYTLRLWMDEDTTIEDVDSMNKLLKAKVVVTGVVSTYSPVEQGITKLSEAILANEYQTSVEAAKEKISNKQAVDFTKPAPIIEWQEIHANTTISTTTTMPHPDLVGNREPKYAQLTSENILPRIGTSYSLDKKTGKYTVENLEYVDPTTLNYNGDKNYYYCGSGFNTDTSDLVQPFGHYTNCLNIYKLVGATSSDGEKIGSGGTVIKTKVYTITGYKYTQNELESDKSDKGIYQATENGEPVYYYRGIVNNNYVKFGGYYWRIIRTNSDGSIKLLYAGSTPNAIGNDLNMKLTDSVLGYTNQTASQYNSIKNDPGYVGYMYGSTLGETYEETNTNAKDSNIKKYLDSWYKQNIVGKGLEEYIADAGFCNDRSLASTVNYPTNGNGVQKDIDTYYEGYERYQKTKSPKLECNNPNDLFTTSSNSNGNRALTYPIGLITIDELMLSGLADGFLNRLAYTYSGNYWTMSPSHYSSLHSAAREYSFVLEGFLNPYPDVITNYNVRGVINLKSDVEITGGIGTANDPFVVKVS